jgi:predicted ATPase
MFKKLRFQNFKSWKDTGEIELAPLTGFFGTNSSGKSSILQFLLMLKQTVESSDRRRVLDTGDGKSYIDLGTSSDFSYRHRIPSQIIFNIEWYKFKIIENFKFSRPSLSPLNPFLPADKILPTSESINFFAKIQLDKENVFVDFFKYKIKQGSLCQSFGMRKKSISISSYEIFSEGYDIKPIENIPQNPLIIELVKNYGFPNEIINYYKNVGFLLDYNLAFEDLFQISYYLGPLREYPQRFYSWSGEQPQDVGRRGELSIAALIACRKSNYVKLENSGDLVSVETRIAMWLKELGLIDSFRVEAIAENRQLYEVRVRRSPNASEVLITDVGFGVSQILPVLVLCYYVPEGSTIILEQPEIHLHPSVQAGLADVFIDVIKTRNVQIILESHSEHLLRRLQLRIAEEKDGLTNEDIQLYFCSMDDEGDSQLTSLQVDRYGNITNWPDNFFGDEMGDLFAMTEAAMKRQMTEE